MARLHDRFLLQNVGPTGKRLGGGAYGVVEELEISGVLRAGKKLHNELVDPRNEGLTNVVVEKYYQECDLLSRLNHPHVVKFLGICFLPDSRFPVLVMERLQTSLDEFLQTPEIPLHTRLAILHDVSKGLVFLHHHEPVIVHRDLTARNVLLDVAMKAKIADLGNSRMTNLQPGELAQTMTIGVPGTLVYMPPEASTGRYGPPLDMFSFGHLSLFTAIQVFPSDLLPPTYTVDQTNEVRGRSELERRGRYITTLEVKFGKRNDLTVFIKDCLANQPSMRPTASPALDRTRSMLDFHALCVREKEKELADVNKLLEQKVMELQQKDDKLKMMEKQLQLKEAAMNKMSLEMGQLRCSNKATHLHNWENRYWKIHSN